MLHITGDTHGGFQRFAVKYFPRQKEMCRDDYVIICGDSGGVWDGSEKENYWLDWLEDKPFTTLFVDGNHENFTMLGALPQYEWRGGKVHRVREHILHLMRGQVFEIDGLTFFTMGGARSHDIQDGILDPASPNFEEQYWLMRRRRQTFRILGRSWWPEEMPSAEEYLTAITALEKVNWKVDCVITHCAPTGVAKQISWEYHPDELTDFLDMISKRLEFQCWLFGHHHRNQTVGQNYTLLWEQIAELGY